MEIGDLIKYSTKHASWTGVVLDFRYTVSGFCEALIWRTKAPPDIKFMWWPAKDLEIINKTKSKLQRKTMFEHLTNCHGEWNMALTILGSLPFFGAWFKSRIHTRKGELKNEMD